MQNTPQHVSVTHDLRFDGDRVVKRYRRWDRGEHLREWRGLRLLAEHAPGLAPEPISAELDADPPVIVMSRLPGVSLGAGPLTPPQVDALATAQQRLQRSVPRAEVVQADPQDGPVEIARVLRGFLAARAKPTESADAAVREAYAAAAAFVGSDWVGRAAALAPDDPVFGICDGNLANYLWDGRSLYVVDLESSGCNDATYDVSDLVEHIATAHGGKLDAENFLYRFDFSTAQRDRIRVYRRAFATYWLLLLLPDGPAHARNPPGTLEAQAARLLSLF